MYMYIQLYMYTIIFGKGGDAPHAGARWVTGCCAQFTHAVGVYVVRLPGSRIRGPPLCPGEFRSTMKQTRPGSNPRIP